MSIWLVVGVLLYAAGAILTYGATLAYFQRHWSSIAREGYRGDVGTAVFMSLTPIGWFLCLFCSRFYQHGLQFSRDLGENLPEQYDER